MSCRRKTKSERELLADINKVFQKFCAKRDCIDCPYRHAHDCKIDYLIDLIEKEYEEEKGE